MCFWRETNQGFSRPRQELGAVVVVATLLTFCAYVWLDPFIVASWPQRREWFHRLPVFAQFCIDHAQWFFYLLCLAAVVLMRRHRAARHAVVLYLSSQLLVSMFVVKTLKVLVARPRPLFVNEVWSAPCFESACQSMPSGHAADVMVGVATVMCCVRWPLLRVLAWGLAFVTMFSRVAQAHHFVSDVVVGAGLSYCLTLSIGAWMGSRVQSTGAVKK